MKTRKEMKKPRIGVCSVGLRHYWGRFPGLRERLIAYGQFISEKLEQVGAEVFRYDLVDCEQEGKRTGEYFISRTWI